MTLTSVTDDLTAPEVIADPYAYYGKLREEDPVHWNALAKCWVVTRYDDALWVARHHELFSNAMGLPDPRDEHPPIDESDWGLGDDFRESFQPFNFTDRPEHLAMRQSIHRWFTPTAIEKWRSYLRETVRDLIEARRADGQMEAKADVATPMPLTTISWMLGVPQSDTAWLQERSNTMMTRGHRPDRMRGIHAAWTELKEYFTPLLEERAKDPGDDLVSMLAEGERRGVFTRNQCLSSIELLMIGGYHTTQNLIAQGLLHFIRNPQQWDLLRTDPEGLSASAVEECLRYVSPVKFLARVALQDVELSGTAVRAGDRVLWVITSANRDPRVFTDSDTFDITRSPNPHIGLGNGVHHCLGASLARVEGQEAFRALAESFPRLQLQNEDIEYHRDAAIHDICALQVCWN